ncbi:MAG: hypothetical protein AAGJ79_09150 [Verrucomicrobiota bacterium]
MDPFLHDPSGKVHVANSLMSPPGESLKHSIGFGGDVTFNDSYL